MAKQKQIPAKQAYYEQILTSQLQPSREEELKSFQADYDNWNKRQQDIAAFQADYDNWVKAQAPVEQPKVETPKVEAPVVKQTAAQPKTAVKAKEEPVKKTYLTHADIIPSLTKVNVDKQKMGRDNYDQMKQLGEGGSVDLFNRPKVSTDELKKAGWNDAGEGTATVFSSTYTNSKGDKAGNFTPIVTDKNGKFVRALTERELTEYAEAVMDGRRKDDLGLQIGGQTSGANAINDAVNAAEKVHELQEKLYTEPQRAKTVNVNDIPDDIIKQAALKWGVSEDEVKERINPSQSKLVSPDSVKMVDKDYFNNLADRLVESYNKRGKIPFSYQFKHWENPYESLTDDEKAVVRNYIQTNKDNPNLTKDEKQILKAFTTIYNDAGNADVDTSNVYNNTMSDAEKKINSFSGGFVATNKPLIDAIAKPVTKALDKTLMPGLLNALGGAENLENQIKNKDSYYNQLFTKAQNDNPSLYEAGKNAGQIYDYALTSPFVGGAAESLGLKGTAAKAANQVFQAAQDLGIDIMPEAKRMIEEEGQINWAELGKRFGLDIFQNVAMEAIPFLAGSNGTYEHLAKTVGNNADIFKTMDSSGAVKNIPDVLREGTDAAKNVLANQKIPDITDTTKWYDEYAPNKNNALYETNAQSAVDRFLNGDLADVSKSNVLEQPSFPDLADASKWYNEYTPKSVEGANPLQTFAENPVDGEWKTSKLRTNTLENTGKITNPDDLPEREFAYRVFKEVEQKAAALDRYKDSVDVASDLLKQDSFDEVDVKAAMDEWQRLMDMGDEASIRKARRLALKLYGETREGGRIVQALAEYSRSTPEGQLKTAQEAIDNLVDKKAGKGTSETLDRVAEKIYKAFDNSNGDKEALKKQIDDILSGDLRKHAAGKTAKKMGAKSIQGKNKIMKMIDKGMSIEKIIDQFYKDNGGVKLTTEEQKKIYDYLTEAAKLPKGSYKQEELYSRAARIAVGRAPSTLGQKIRSILYANMLGNFKTALSRNAFGNLGYQALEQARQPITAVVDWGTSAFTGKRSALGWNPGKGKAYLSGLRKGTKEQLVDMLKHIDTGRSGAKGWEVALGNNATTFNDSNLIGKFANDVEYFVRNAMELGDRPFFEANYKQNYTELMQLIDKYGKENVAGLEGIKDAYLPEFMDMIASVRAADSVFQKHGKMSKGLTDLRNGLGEMSEGIIGTDILSTAASPFTMTPGNMIERAIEYTPLGFGKNAIETIREVAGKKGFNQRRFVDEASRSITGLPILFGTYKMAENGLINGGYSTDPDEKAAQQEDGFIEYGFNVPEGVPIYGGKTLDTSDIPVIGPFMQAGAVMAEDGITPMSGLQAGEAVLGGSTTQGFRRVFGSETPSYSSQNSVMDNLKNTVLSSGSQFIPSLARQTAQTLDPYKRDLGEYGTPEYYLNLMKNSDPIGRQTLPIKTDVEGNPVLQNQGRPLPEKILENYVLPMNVSEYKPSELNQEATRLLKATGENKGFAPKAYRSHLKAWDEAEEKVYTEKQYRKYKEDLGKLNASMGNTLIKSDEYAKLTDVEKAKALGDAYTAMKQIARFNVTGNMDDNNLAEIYKEAGFGEKGVEAVIKEIDVKAALKRNEVTDSDSAREIYSNYGDAGLKTYAEIKKKLNKSQKGEDIAAAVDSIPGLNRDKKAEYYSYVDTDAKPNNNPFGYVPGINYDPEKDKTFSTAKKLIPTLTPEKYYKTKDSIDTDGNGNIKESEILEYINANARNEEEANNMWTAYHGESKNKKGQIKKVIKKGNKYISTY